MAPQFSCAETAPEPITAQSAAAARIIEGCFKDMNISRYLKELASNICGRKD